MNKKNGSCKICNAKPTDYSANYGGYCFNCAEHSVVKGFKKDLEEMEQMINHLDDKIKTERPQRELSEKDKEIQAWIEKTKQSVKKELVANLK